MKVLLLLIPMPFDVTLDNLAAARLAGSEIVPDDIKNFAPAFLRLVQYDYDSAILWRHDLATANAVAEAFSPVDAVAGTFTPMYGKAAVADLRKTTLGRKIINSEGGMALDAVGIADIVGNSDRAEAMGLNDADGLYNYLYDNVVIRRRSLASDAKAYADQRLADDDRQAEKTADVPGEAYRKYLDEVEASVLRMRGYDQWQRGEGTPLSLVMPSPGK